MYTKNDITKTTKFRSLQYLCEIIPDRVQSGKNLYRCLMRSDTISDKIISDIYVSCTLDTWSYTIIFQFDGALVIFMDNTVIDLVSPLFQ